MAHRALGRCGPLWEGTLDWLLGGRLLSLKLWRGNLWQECPADIAEFSLIGGLGAAFGAICHNNHSLSDTDRGILLWLVFTLAGIFPAGRDYFS